MTVGGPWARQRVELDVPGLSIAAGQAYKWFPDVKFGGIDDFDNNSTNASLTTLGEQNGTQIYPYQSTPFDLEALSDSTDDAVAGIGGRRLLVQGLDEDWLLREKIVNLNGTTAVAIPAPAEGKQWLRVTALRLTAAGSNGINVGVITVQIPGGSPPIRMANIVARAGRSANAMVTIPADFVGFLKRFQMFALPEGGIEGGGTGQLPQFVGAMMLRDNDPEFGVDPEAGDFPPFYTYDISAGEPHDYIVPLLLPPKTDVELRLFNTDLNNSAVGGVFQMVARRLTPEELNGDGTEAFKRWMKRFRMFM